MTAKIPQIHRYLKKTQLINRPGMSGKIAVVGAFDSLETEPQLFATVGEAQDTFGTDTTYNGCAVVPYLFKGASSLLAVNITTENQGTRSKTITTTNLTDALAKIKNEDWDILFVADILTDAFIPIINSCIAERFELTYVDQNNQKVRPVVIHRAILGSMDRFVAFLLEETKGVLPVWLAPVQVMVIPVNNQFHLEYSNQIVEMLKGKRIRVKMDDREEKLGYKIREAQMKKIPYQLVIGDNEVKDGTITYREYGKKEQVTVSKEEFLNMMVKFNEERK